MQRYAERCAVVVEHIQAVCAAGGVIIRSQTERCRRCNAAAHNGTKRLGVARARELAAGIYVENGPRVIPRAITCRAAVRRIQYVSAAADHDRPRPARANGV